MFTGTQPRLTLYHSPGACSSVSLCALEEAGLDYELELVNLAKGGQFAESYQRVSPLGKVPVLAIDGEPLYENVAILTYIAALRPDAGLLPGATDPRAHADAVSGLAFCAGTMHPTIRGLLRPEAVTDGDPAGVRSRSEALAAKGFGYADRRLAAHGGWWLGQWSIVDVYLAWTLMVAARASYDLTAFPELLRLEDRLLERPAFRRMVEINTHSRAALEAAPERVA